jgi:hypothetical protein
MGEVLPLILIIAIISAGVASVPAYAATNKSISTRVSASVGTVFATKVYQPDGKGVLYSTTVPFLNVDPTKTFALPDQRSENDDKSDIGIYCVNGSNRTWYLKIGIAGGNLPPNKLKYYLGQPYIWKGSRSVSTDGVTMPNPPEWTPIPTGKSVTIYQSGASDTINAPQGTLLTLSFQLDPSGLVGGVYMAQVTYTMTTQP